MTTPVALPLARSTSVLRSCVLAIAVVTVASGAVQLFAPGLVLRIVAGPAGDMAAHFFSIVGMFMVLFGGLLLHALGSGGEARVVLLWCALQKMGASAAVGMGVSRDVFSTPALLVAGFDFVSGLLFFWYRSAQNDR